jgi:ribosomal-protein-alanine N-acetyltransferase
MMRTLRGAGVVLEPQRAAHAAELYAVIGDPSLYAFIDEKEPESETALRERLAMLEERRSRDGRDQWLNWVVRAGDTLVGYVQATLTPDTGAEIAYVLGREHWRRGYGSAAVRLMLDELAGHYGARRAIATLDPENAASLALLRKLGFALVDAWPDRQEVRYALRLSGDP